MGGQIGCICLDDRHETLDPAKVAQGALGQAAIVEAAAVLQEQANFKELSPRSGHLTATEVEKRRNAAAAWLSSTCNGDDAAAIQNAIGWAKSAGVSQAEIDDAEARLKRIGARHKARSALARAVEEGNETSLRQAVTLADEAGIDASEFEQAIGLIEQLEQGSADPADRSQSEEKGARRLAMDHLQEAMTTRGQRELEKAIAEAEGVGLGTKSERAALAQARVMLNIVNARKQAALKRRAKDCSSCVQEAIHKAPCGANAA